jgi:glycosyltransferase involved in cell wall biosynthesis
MKDGPLVSVVIIVKDGERYLAKAISSVRAQIYENHEIIVVDGNSSDGTEQVARSFPEVRFVRQAGKGTADAYNTGIDAARGELVSFLSHDDLWTPNKLSAQVGYMLEHPEVQYTNAKIRFFLEAGEAVPREFKPELLEGEHAVRIMETLVARRGLFESLGKLSPEYSPADDVEWYARAKDRNVPSAVVPEVLLFKRVHGSNTSLADPERNNRLLLQILRQSIKRQQGRRAAGAEGPRG